MFIADIFTTILNQAYMVKKYFFSPLKKNHTNAFKRSHQINYFNKCNEPQFI